MSRVLTGRPVISPQLLIWFAVTFHLLVISTLASSVVFRARWVSCFASSSFLLLRLSIRSSYYLLVSQSHRISSNFLSLVTHWTCTRLLAAPSSYFQVRTVTGAVNDPFTQSNRSCDFNFSAAKRHTIDLTPAATLEVRTYKRLRPNGGSQRYFLFTQRSNGRTEPRGRALFLRPNRRHIA
jgi:hypothetical protein